MDTPTEPLVFDSRDDLIEWVHKNVAPDEIWYDMHEGGACDEAWFDDKSWRWQAQDAGWGPIRDSVYDYPEIIERHDAEHAGPVVWCSDPICGSVRS